MPHQTLIEFGEDGPVEIINPDARRGLVFTGDHAGNRIPRAMNGLGLGAQDLARHIAWDIGAAAVARRLAAEMNATAVLARYSRLLIDPNRALGEKECIPEVSDGTAIPGNVSLSAAAIQARADTFYWPYHQAVDEQIGRLRGLGRAPAVVAIHSFTPALSARDHPRPWHVGVMFSYDDSFARKLIAGLRAEGGLVVGENEPYSGFTLSYAQKIHGLAQMLPHAQIEVRQDLIGDEAGQRHWASLLGTVIAVALGD